MCKSVSAISSVYVGYSLHETVLWFGSCWLSVFTLGNVVSVVLVLASSLSVLISHSSCQDRVSHGASLMATDIASLT